MGWGFPPVLWGFHKLNGHGWVVSSGSGGGGGVNHVDVFVGVDQLFVFLFIRMVLCNKLSFEL